MKKVLIVTTTLLVGVSTFYIMNRKRRRLLEVSHNGKVFNNVAKDFGGTVPGPLFNYLKSLGKDTKIRGNYKLYGYKQSLDLSKTVYNGLENDVLIILGEETSLTSELGKMAFLAYSKEGYPNSLIIITHNEDNKELEYYSSVDFKILH